LHPDVLVGNSTPATAALLRETRTIQRQPRYTLGTMNAQIER